MESSAVTFLGIAACFAAAIYGSFHLLLAIGLMRRPSRQERRAGDVSVIVAARNESDHIGVLLEALRAQTRRPEEIIIVDDRSDDGTGEIVESYRSGLPALRLIRVNELPAGAAPKKHALETGIAASAGEILCFTDADCIPPPHWLQRVESLFSPDTGVVVGMYAPVWEADESGLSFARGILRRFIDYERFKTSALAAGSAGLRFPWLASGSNFSYRRTVFNEVGGFTGLHGSLSGDDDLFVQRVRRATQWQVVALTDPEATVRTLLPSRWRAFLRQRMRHFSAGRWYDPAAMTLLAFYHGSNSLATLALLGAILYPSSIFLTAYVGKVCADLILLAAGDMRLRRASAWAWFLPLELMNVFFVAVAGPIGLLARVRWKERMTS